MKLAPVLFLALALGGSAAQAAEGQTEAAKPVLVMTVRLQPSSPEHRLPGVIRARTESDLGFRIAGKVIRRLVDAGQVVDPGQALAELDPTDLRLQLQQAEAELQAARTARDSAVNELSRVSSLRQGGWSTSADLDKQKAIADEAQSRFDRAARAVALAQNALTYTTLRADAPEVITATLAEPGQVVAAGQTVMRAARLDQKEIAVAVPESLLEETRDDKARATLWAIPGKSYEAALRQLSPNADPATRTYLARYSLADAGPEVILGMTATLILAQRPELVAPVPLTAILDEGQGPTVWIVNRDG
ncbi:MAG: efflux RND transporter periplasmic adaptor subunit, partial [Acetobacteraceae bacterium]|nr:efflux RND transporter periplasmic adaptor subunit [Acetobacteraceae bacterium]